jgi:hypothetical protein
LMTVIKHDLTTFSKDIRLGNLHFAIQCHERGWLGARASCPLFSHRPSIGKCQALSSKTQARSASAGKRFPSLALRACISRHCA